MAHYSKLTCLRVFLLSERVTVTHSYHRNRNPQNMREEPLITILENASDSVTGLYVISVSHPACSSIVSNDITSIMMEDDRPDANASLYSCLMAAEVDIPQVYTTATPPFIITYANSAWERLCGFTAEAAVGRTCAILHGERTCKRTLGQVSAAS